MPRYPALDAALEGRDLDELAARTGVPADVIRSWVPGGLAATLSQRDRIARALGGNAIDLFRLDADLEAALPADRFVTDPATLRTIDRRLAS